MATKDAKNVNPDKDAPPIHEEAKQPTESSLKEADKVSGPYIGDADLIDPPVRSASPQEPMVGTLAVGAGKHEPNDDPHFDSEGRWHPEPVREDA